MKRYRQFLILAVLTTTVFTYSCVQEKQDAATVLANGHWIDLTWSFDENTVYWPTNVKFRHDTVFYGINDKGQQFLFKNHLWLNDCE